VYGTVDTLEFNSVNPVDNRELNLTEYLVNEPTKANSIRVYSDAGKWPTRMKLNMCKHLYSTDADLTPVRWLHVSAVSFYMPPVGCTSLSHAPYHPAGFPTYVDANKDNFPDSWNPRYTLAQAKIDHLAGYREDFQPSLVPRLPGLNGASTPRVLNGEGVATGSSSSLSDDRQGLRLDGFNDVGPTAGGQTAHTLADIPLYASGPGSEMVKPHMDNLELHFLMAKALGLGTKAAIMPAMAGQAVKDVTCDAVVPSVVQHATLGLLTTVCPSGSAYCDATRPLVVGRTTYYRMVGSMTDLKLKVAGDTCVA
jgi:hypothetical protein